MSPGGTALHEFDKEGVVKGVFSLMCPAHVREGNMGVGGTRFWQDARGGRDAYMSQGSGGGVCRGGGRGTHVKLVDSPMEPAGEEYTEGESMRDKHQVHLLWEVAVIDVANQVVLENGKTVINVRTRLSCKPKRTVRYVADMQGHTHRIRLCEHLAKRDRCALSCAITLWQSEFSGNGLVSWLYANGLI